LYLITTRTDYSQQLKDAATAARVNNNVEVDDLIFLGELYGCSTEYFMSNSGHQEHQPSSSGPFHSFSSGYNNDCTDSQHASLGVSANLGSYTSSCYLGESKIKKVENDESNNDLFSDSYGECKAKVLPIVPHKLLRFSERRSREENLTSPLLTNQYSSHDYNNLGSLTSSVRAVSSTQRYSSAILVERSSNSVTSLPSRNIIRDLFFTSSSHRNEGTINKPQHKLANSRARSSNRRNAIELYVRNVLSRTRINTRI